MSEAKQCEECPWEAGTYQATYCAGVCRDTLGRPFTIAFADDEPIEVGPLDKVQRFENAKELFGSGLVALPESVPAKTGRTKGYKVCPLCRRFRQLDDDILCHECNELEDGRPDDQEYVVWLLEQAWFFAELAFKPPGGT